MWCGPWAAPGAQYIRNGLSGENAWCRFSQARPFSAMSSVRWYFSLLRRLDRVLVLVQPRLPLRRLAGEEAVEVVEPVAGRPAVERAHRGGLVRGGVVPLPECRRLVAVMVQHLGDGGGRLRDDAGVAVEVGGPLGDRAVADAVVVPPGQQGRAGRRADRRGVERVVADPFGLQPCERRRVALAAERVRERRSPRRRCSTIRTFGAPGLSRSGSFRHVIFDSCKLGPAMLAEGSAGTAAPSRPPSRERRCPCTGRTSRSAARPTRASRPRSRPRPVRSVTGIETARRRLRVDDWAREVGPGAAHTGARARRTGYGPVTCRGSPATSPSPRRG